MKPNILVADDEEGIRSFIEAVLTGDGCTVSLAEDGQQAWELLQKKQYHVLVTDLKMPRLQGLELLEKTRRQHPETEVVVLTAHGTVENAVEAMKLGAFDYLSKPLESPEELRLVVQRALERRQLKDERERRQTVSGGVSMVAEDPATKKVVDQLCKVAPTNTSVLLVGESGTGKEVAAKLVHEHSPRCDGPFVAVNCAALSETLMESEMFGHEKGAFTGATSRRRGRFELADGGTLFLDEVGELKPDLQAKLLRVIEDHRFERVGGSQVIEVDVRLIAATNRNLEEEMQSGGFREDLYHRLAVFPIHLPPLRQRPKDVLPLAEHLLGRTRVSLGRSQLELSESAKKALKRYHWPGNVRELNNVLERAAILCEDDTIEEDDLVLSSPSATEAPVLQGSLQEIEKEAIRQALEAVDGHRKQAAERLGIGLRTLYGKIKDYDLK